MRAITLTINGEDTDNSVTFDSGTDSDVSGRTKTSASVSWSPSEWTGGSSGSAERTPDIKTVIQQIVDLSGWSSGNSLSIIISKDSGSGLRRAESYDGVANSEPELFITYTLNQYLVSRYDNDQGFKVWMDGNGKLVFDVDDDGLWGPDYQVKSTNPYDDNANHFFTVVREGSTAIRLYVDGSLVTSDTTIGTWIPGTFSTRVSQSSDDAEEHDDGSMDITSSDLELVQESDTQQVGMRFQSVTIPSGSTITNAYVQFTADEAHAAATSLTLYGEDIDNAPTFTSTNADISGREKTSASVSWPNIPEWSVGESGPDTKTTELKTIIQEIVDRTGWASGNALVIIVTGAKDNKRVAESQDGSSANAPQLVVSYNAPPLGTLTSDSAPLSFGTDEPTNAEYFDGIMDEFRISDALRSADWIKASYRSQNDEVLSYGYEEIESIPAYNDASWTSLGVQQNDAATDAADIENSDAGETNLELQSDGTFIYFQFYLEAAPAETTHTYSVLMDTDDDGDYEYCLASYGTSGFVRLYTWGGTGDSGDNNYHWDNDDVETFGDGYSNFDGSNYVVQFAVPIADIGNPAGDWKAKAAIYGYSTTPDADAYEEDQSWEETNDPTPTAAYGDYTASATIPEFSGAVLPVVFVAALFVFFRKRKK